jgi:hypothetical protein
MATSEWRPGDALRPAERAMLAAAESGEWLGDPAETPVPVEEMRKRGARRTVRAAVVRHQLVADEWPVHARGLKLAGIKVTGTLDLEAAVVRCPIFLVKCLLDAPVHAVLARTRSISLHRCHLRGLDAMSIEVAGRLCLDGSTVPGGVVVSGGTVTGPFSCRGAHLGPDDDGNALFADRLVAGGGVHLEGGFRADGVVRLHTATITGSLNARDAQLDGRDTEGDALVGDGLHVGFMVMDRMVVSRGAVRLPRATIRDLLMCSGVRLDGRNERGVSFDAEGASIGGHAFLDDGFSAAGEVRFARADVAGQVVLRGATLTGLGAENVSFNGIGLHAHADTFLDDGFTAAGAVAVVDARLDGSLYLDGSHFFGFAGVGATVGHAFRWLPAAPVVGFADLTRMTVGVLVDDWKRPNAHWPPAPRVALTGFTYGSFDGSGASVPERLDWIRLQYGDGTPFTAQPYEQLARVYRATGHDTDARKVAIARRNDLRKYGELTRFRRAWSRVLDVTIRHGYEPWRAVAFLLALYVFVVSVFTFAQHQTGSMVPARTVAKPLPADAARHCRAGYPCFYPLTYALDLVVPILDVQDADAWRPDTHRPWRWAYALLGVLANLFGWGASTLAVLGYTGIVRRE